LQVVLETSNIFIGFSDVTSEPVIKDHLKTANARRPGAACFILLSVYLASLSCSAALRGIVRNFDNHMTNWKVIALVSGNIEAVSGPAAQNRPGTHEWIVWQGAAADKAEALQSAEKADPRVDLEWMRIRYERDLDVR